MTGERSGAATVIQQDGSQLQVRHRKERLTVPMVGFPEGFQLRPGERVVLVDEPSGPVARPLVRTATAQVEPATLLSRGEIPIGGQRLALQQSSLVYEPEGQQDPGSPGRYVLWIIEPGEAEGPSQVIAVRPSR